MHSVELLGASGQKEYKVVRCMCKKELLLKPKVYSRRGNVAASFCSTTKWVEGLIRLLVKHENVIYWVDGGIFLFSSSILLNS